MSRLEYIVYVLLFLKSSGFCLPVFYRNNTTSELIYPGTSDKLLPNKNVSAGNFPEQNEKTILKTKGRPKFNNTTISELEYPGGFAGPTEAEAAAFPWCNNTDFKQHCQTPLKKKVAILKDIARTVFGYRNGSDGSMKGWNFRLSRKTKPQRDIQAVDPDDGQESQAEPPYTLLINEVNLDNPGPNTNIYFELEAVDRPFPKIPGKSDLHGFLFIIVRGDPLEVVLSVDIGSAINTVSKKYLVIGSKEIANVDINLDSEDVSSIFPKQQPLPDFDGSPFAIMVLYSRLESVLGDVSLEKNDAGAYTALRLVGDERRQDIIRNNLVDMVIVGRKAGKNYCPYFESLKPAALVDRRRTVLLRDRDSTALTNTRDLSLSRCCGDKRPNDQECWKLSTPSAGMENNCEFRRPFYLENVLRRISDETEAEPESSEEILEGCQSQYPPGSSGDAALDDHNYAQLVTQEVTGRLQCPATPPVQSNEPENVPGEAMEVDYEDDVLFGVRVPRHQFDPDELRKCRKHLPKRIDQINVPAITRWLEIIRVPGKCKFRCYQCAFFLQQGFRPEMKNPGGFVTDGYSSSNPSLNKAQIVDHASPNNPESFMLHQVASEYVTSLQEAKNQRDVDKAEKKVREYQKTFYRATMDAMLLAWAELRAEISFRSHPIFVQAAKDLKVNLGFYHSGFYALRRYAKAYSLGFHKRLLKYLTEQNRPFSFMVDATTNRNVGYLVCLIQTLERDRPVLYFWRLIRLTKSESGFHMMQDIERSVDEDERLHPGFRSYFMTNLIAFISDRGSPMVGHRIGLIAQLRVYVGHHVQSVPCSAHVTETAIKHALNVPTSTPVGKEKPDRYFMKFGDLNNKFYTYFMSRGSKRWSHLQDVAEEIGLKASRIKYHHTIRWSKSKKLAMAALLKDYDAIRIDLERASKGKGEHVVKAKQLLEIISDKSFGSTLAEFIDLLGVSEKLLNSFQMKHGLVLGLSGSLRDAIKKYEVLKAGEGKTLRTFLSRMSCPGVCNEGSCTLAQYDACEIVQFRHSSNEQVSSEDQTMISTGDSRSSETEEEEEEEESDSVPADNILTLTKKDPKSVPLSQWRDKLYERLITEIKVLFEAKKIEAFDVMDPKMFKFACPGPSVAQHCDRLDGCYNTFLPLQGSDIAETATDKITRLCRFYSIGFESCFVLIEEWKTLLSQLVVSEQYQTISENRSPEEFWTMALHDPAITWQANIRNFITNILVTGQSSAAAERAFSTLSRIGGSDRSSLLPDTLDDLIRIKVNGPDRIDEDSLLEYTLLFLQRHKTVDQPKNRQAGTSKTKEAPQPEVRIESFSRSRIFSSLL